MFRNYLKIAVRNLLKHKTFSFINISGVAIGLACFLLLSLYVKDELSYDRFHANAERIYRLNRTFLSKDGTESLRLGHAAPPFGPLVKQDFPEVEQVVRLLEMGGLIEHGENIYNESDVFAAEANIFKVFSFKVIQGNPDKALENPFSIMFSKKMAEKYFGNTDSMGKVITHDKKYRYEVIGIIKIHRQILHCNLTFWTIYNLTKRMKREVWLYTWIKYNWKNNYRA